jgi:hypothetical protein
MPAFLEGAAPGASGEMTESGWSNGTVFENYLTNHFARHAGITDDPDQEPTLILFDGHKSHVRLTLTEWARQRNVTLFLLPPHTSHITQPLDVAIFGPLKNMYYRECATYMQQNPGATITKYEIAKLSSKPYLKAMSADNLVSSFRKTGILPLQTDIFESMPESTAPATIYANDDLQSTADADQTGGEVRQSTDQTGGEVRQSTDQTGGEVRQPTDQTGEVGQTSTNNEQNKENINSSNFLPVEQLEKDQ